MASANTDYQIVTATSKGQLIIDVKAAIAAGWTVIGNAIRDGQDYSQTMVKP